MIYKIYIKEYENDFDPIFAESLTLAEMIKINLERFFNDATIIIEEIEQK